MGKQYAVGYLERFSTWFDEKSGAAARYQD